MLRDACGREMKGSQVFPFLTGSLHVPFLANVRLWLKCNASGQRSTLPDCRRWWLGSGGTC